MSRLAKPKDDALRIIETALAHCRKPVAMCSFGKDSMAMLHLLRLLRPEMPVLWHREVFHYTPKYAFAHRMIAEWGLTVMDFPPSATGVIERNGKIDVANEYRHGTIPIFLPTRLTDNGGVPGICAVHDVLLRPTGTLLTIPWDCVFIGHKSSDTDSQYGRVPVDCDLVMRPGAPMFAYPLRRWTDDEVWEFTRAEGIPYHTDQYQEDGRERRDRSLNPDEFAACVSCIRTGTGGIVYCPRLGCEVNSIANQVPRASFPKLICQKKEDVCQAG